jgi:hypothetical protein
MTEWVAPSGQSSMRCGFEKRLTHGTLERREARPQ